MEKYKCCECGKDTMEHGRSRNRKRGRMKWIKIN